MMAPMAGAVNYRGDFNRDSKVDMNDMSMLASAIKEGNADTKFFDINADGVVDDRDLQVLANVILTKSLVEDNGVNVGIGGWGDGGEWGGTVGVPKRIGQRNDIGDGISFHAENKYDYAENITWTEIYLDTKEPVSGVLIDFGVPAWDSFIMDEKSVEPIVMTTDHRMYGKMARITEEDSPWVKYRVMLFSPTFAPFEPDGKPILKFRYKKEDWAEGRWMPFEGCQAVLPVSGKVADIPHSGTELVWGYRPLRDFLPSETSVEMKPGEEKEIYFTWIPEDATGREQYEISVSNEERLIVGNQTFRIILYCQSSEYSEVTIHTTDGSDITKHIYVNKLSGVSDIENDDECKREPVYTIQGIPLGSLTRDELESLPAGLYIRGGKKIWIKGN